MERYLRHLGERIHPQEIGHKAGYLRWLFKHGYTIPRTYVIPLSAHAAYCQDADRFRRDFTSQVAAAIRPGCSYALRSSANVEDSQHYSFAGQFVSQLNLASAGQIVQAAETIFASSSSADLLPYTQRAGLETGSIAMGLVLQEMVTAQFAGVAFSRNPLTSLDEIIVEAVPGSSQALLQDGVTPQRWVYKWGAFIQQPPADGIDPTIIRQVVAGVQKIARQFGAPVDLEWVFDGSELFWIQLRPITRLDEIAIYSSRIAQEVLPGLIKPLVWSVNTPLVNSAWVEFFGELIGPNDLDPHRLARAFHYRAYFNMGAIGQIFASLGLPRESIELVMGMKGGAETPSFSPSRRVLRHLPRFVAFLARKLRYQKAARAFLIEAQQQYQELAKVALRRLSQQELLDHLSRLSDLTRRAAYANIVIPLLLNAYHQLLRRQLESRGIDYAGFDLTHGMPQLKDYQPHAHLSALAQSFARLDPTTRERIRAEGAALVLRSPPGPVHDFSRPFQQYLERFGHLSDSGNDFSSVPFRENPDLVLQMVLAYPAQQAGRQKAGWEDLPLSPLRRAFLQPLYRRARLFVLLREQISSLYTFGYGLFRDAFLELGRRFTGQGWIDQPEDIFYLYLDEVRQLALSPQEALPVRSRVAERRQEMQASQALKLPEVIYGDQPPPLMATTQPEQGASTTLRGIPSSRGYYRGRVKVIRSVAEIARLNPGDVLVIPYSDVSWTPLFARAGAVIAESGGVLSHSSIVAREYGLPCIVSVPQACQLPDNTLVAIDGHQGEIRIIAEG